MSQVQGKLAAYADFEDNIYVSFLRTSLLLCYVQNNKKGDTMKKGLWIHVCVNN